MKWVSTINKLPENNKLVFICYSDILYLKKGKSVVVGFRYFDKWKMENNKFTPKGSNYVQRLEIPEDTVKVEFWAEIEFPKEIRKNENPINSRFDILDIR